MSSLVYMTEGARMHLLSSLRERGRDLRLYRAMLETGALPAGHTLDDIEAIISVLESGMDQDKRALNQLNS